MISIKMDETKGKNKFRNGLVFFFVFVVFRLTFVHLGAQCADNDHCPATWKIVYTAVNSQMTENIINCNYSFPSAPKCVHNEPHVLIFILFSHAFQVPTLKHTTQYQLEARVFAS